MSVFVRRSCARDGQLVLVEVRSGVCNMQHHIRSARKYGVPVVVALNKFATDTQAEVAIVIAAAKEAGAVDAVLANHWAEGGAGGDKSLIDTIKGITWLE